MSSTVSFPKVGIITQARVGSSRLPRKTLREVANRTLLEYHLSRLKSSHANIYLATTYEPEAEKLIEIAARLAIDSMRGSLDDVLSRFYVSAKKNELDVIVRVTSDCPLIDGSMIKEGIQQFMALPNWSGSYLSNTQIRLFPRGFDFEIFSFDLLREAHLNAIELSEREHVTPYIYRRSNANIVQYEDPCLKLDQSKYRITVDTVEDFHLIERLIGDFGAAEKSYLEIIKILEAHEELSLMNSSVEQKVI